MHQDMQGDVMQKLTGDVVVKGVGSGQGCEGSDLPRGSMERRNGWQLL